MSLATDIARRMLSGRAAVATVKAAPKPSAGTPKRPEPAQAATAWPVINAIDNRAKSPERQVALVVAKASNRKHLITPPHLQPSETARVSTPKAGGREPRPDQGPRLRSAPVYVPPRVEPDLVEAYRALPEVWGPAETPPLPPPVVAPGWKGSCKAVCATTGRTCKLPAHGGTAHRHERGEFFRVAAPGTTSFPLRQALDAAAMRQAEGAVELGRPSLGKGDVRAKPRKSAHAGDSTSTGIKSLDTNPNHEAA